MSRQARDDARPALALLLSLALALAPALLAGLAPTVAAQNGGEGNGSQPEQGEANRSEEQGGPDERGRSGDGRPGGPDERPSRGPPVEVEDRRGGFATRAPPDSPRPEVAVDAANATARVDRGNVEALDVHLDEVLAFTDEDGDGAYDVGEPVLDRNPLPDRPSHLLRAGPDQREIVYELGEGASMSLLFNVSGQRGEHVGAKFDVAIHNYTFEGNDTHVAVGSRVQVDGGLERVDRDGQPAVAGEQGEEVAYLSWVPTVDVDGVEHPVGSSVHVDAEEPSESAIVYWAYPQGEEVVHDPELGVQDAVRELAGRLAPFALGLAATATVLFAGYAVRARGPP